MSRTSFPSVPFLLLALVSPTAAHATDAADVVDFCSAARDQAAGERALAFAPEAFAAFGVVSGSDAVVEGASQLPPTERLTAGLRYDLLGLVRGGLETRRAGAACRRYRAASVLLRFALANREVRTPASARAQADVLTAAIPEAERRLAAVRVALDHGLATLDDVTEVELRLDELRRERELALADADLPAPPAALDEGIEHVAAEVERAAAAQARAESRLRGLETLSLSVRGGYDRVFGLRDELPLFGVVALSVNLGAPAAFHFAARRGEAMGRVEQESPDGAIERARRVVTRLRLTAERARHRLVEVRTLSKALAERTRVLDATGGERAERLRSTTWFALVRLRAEEANLVALERDAARWNDGGGR